MTSPDNFVPGGPNTGWDDVGDLADALGTQGILGLLFGGFSGIGELLGKFGQAFFGSSSSGLSGFLADLFGWRNQTESAISYVTQDLLDAKDIMVTEVITPMSDSLGGQDIPSFSRQLLVPRPTSTATADGGDGDGSGGQNGNHKHDIVYEPVSSLELPTYKPANRTLDLTFIRVDRKMTINRMKMITGRYSSGWLGGLAAWYMGVYIWDPQLQKIRLMWGSGDVKDTISSAEQEYRLISPTTEELLPGHLVAVAQLQRTTTLGSTRTIAAIPQAGIAQSGSEFPAGQCAYVNNLDTLPTEILPSALNYNHRILPWVAVSRS